MPGQVKEMILKNTATWRADSFFLSSHFYFCVSSCSGLITQGREKLINSFRRYAGLGSFNMDLTLYERKDSSSLVNWLGNLILSIEQETIIRLLKVNLFKRSLTILYASQ